VTNTKDEFRGKLGKMSSEEMEAFLGRGINAYLACVDDDGHPYMTVVWHEWRDGAFWFVARERATWAGFLAKDPRMSIIVEVPDTHEKVWAKGLAEVIEKPNVGGEWVNTAERMSLRYLGEDGPKYLVPTMQQPRWLFKATPTELKTWQGTGWAKRYWNEQSGGPSYEKAHGLADRDEGAQR
jgi:general stress protein 26